MKRTERGEQIALVQKCRLLANRYPALSLLHHVPNGEKRDKATAATLERMGVLPGIPDLCLPVPGDGYHALYIEMKTDTGRVRPLQADMHRRLAEAGNRVVVCRSVEEAWKMISYHLGITETV